MYFQCLSYTLFIVVCKPISYRCAGYHSEADAPSRRLAKPLIFCRTESDCPMENGYARPVEGIHVLVDMQNMVVIEFEDRKLVHLPPADPLRNYTAGETRGGVDRSDVKPLQIIQPEGPSFRVNGHFVEWQKVLAYFKNDTADSLVFNIILQLINLGFFNFFLKFL